MVARNEIGIVIASVRYARSFMSDLYQRTRWFFELQTGLLIWTNSRDALHMHIGLVSK